MLEFKFRNEKIIYTPQMFLINDFVNLYEADKTSGKTKSDGWFYYIFLLASLHDTNPNRDVGYEDRDAEARYRVYKSRVHQFSQEEIDILTPAINTYVTLNTNAEERSLSVFDFKVDQLRQTIEDTEPFTFVVYKRNNKQYKTNSKIISDSLKGLDKVKGIKIQVVASIKRMAISSKVRGSVELSPLAKGRIQLTSIGEWENDVRNNSTDDGIASSIAEDDEDDASQTAVRAHKEKDTRKQPLKFELYKGKLILTRENILLESLQELYDTDKSDKYEDTLSAMKYVFMLMDKSVHNPINNVRYDDREHYAALYAFGDGDIDINTLWFSDSIADACEEYEEYIHESDIEISTYNRKLDQLCDMVKGMRPVIETIYSDVIGDDGYESERIPVDFSSNISIIIDTLENVVNIILSKASIVSIHIEGKAPKRLRGTLSPLATGAIMISDQDSRINEVDDEDEDDAFLTL